MTESNAQFLARMSVIAEGSFPLPNRAEFKRLIALAEERVMIEEHKMSIIPPCEGEFSSINYWDVAASEGYEASELTLSTAIRSVVAKIGEGNG